MGEGGRESSARLLRGEVGYRQDASGLGHRLPRGPGVARLVDRTGAHTAALPAQGNNAAVGVLSRGNVGHLPWRPRSTDVPGLANGRSVQVVHAGGALLPA